MSPEQHFCADKTSSFVGTKVARNIPRCQICTGSLLAPNTQSPPYPDLEVGLYAYNVKVIGHYKCQTLTHLWFTEMLTVNLISCNLAAIISRFKIAMNWLGSMPADIGQVVNFLQS